MTVSSAAVLAAALSLSQYVGDKVDTPERRETLYRPVAEAIARLKPMPPCTPKASSANAGT